ncbi:MAG: hypothetical protein H0V46_04275 [Sphingomonas sp.]|nr:hypothetical protein [Sphingomonas sp.]
MAERKRRPSPHRGDVFELPTTDGRFGYGLVIVGGGRPYIAILRGVYDSRPAVDELEHKHVGLVGWTMDSWFYHGRWAVVGKLDPDGFPVPYPNYIVGIDGELHATDYKGEVLGPASPDERDLLDYQSSRSPVGFHNAFLALHGYRDWDAGDDKLTADHARLRMTRT